LALSSAFFKALISEQGKEIFEFFSKPKIPLPICNVVGGWKGQSDIQEFLLLPSSQKKFFNSIEKISSAYLEIAESLKKIDPKFNFGKNIESGWVTSLNFDKILEVLAESLKENDLVIGLDFAASQLWNGKKYVYSNGELLATQQLDLIEDLAGRFPIEYIEDPFHEEDFISFSALTHGLKEKIVCADDLVTTNLGRLKICINYKAANAVIIKPSQVGTISEVIKVVEEAKKNGIKTVMSHRSGETEDTLISHLAVALGCDYIKLGISGERTTKINEIIRIEDSLQ